MEPRRYKLNPDISAAENLGLAVRYAVPVVLSRYRLGNLDDYTLNELYADIRTLAYAHFILHKVRGHKYCRVSKEGIPLSFFDNVISSVWSVTGNALDRLMRQLKKKYKTVSMEKAIFENKDIWDIMPDRGSLLENNYYPEKHRPTEILKNDATRPGRRLNKLELEYSDYQVDCVLLGIDPISEEAWVERNSSNGEEIHEYRLRKTRTGTTSERRRQYMREYQRERRRQKREAEYKQFLEDPNYQGKPGRFK